MTITTTATTATISTITHYHQAAQTGDLEAIQQYLQAGGDINALNRTEESAILIAAKHQQYDVVQFLIEQGADINLQDQICFNPFLWGCIHNDLKLVEMMLNAGADLKRLTRFGGVGITPAAEKGHLEMVQLLLEKSAINVNHTNFVGWTPLLEAIILNDGGATQQAIIRLLLAHGADPNMTDKYGKTPLFLAKERGFDEIAQILENAGGH
ncbi:ankyrin repeat domain-containing protein [Ignatzschineria larvae DSM 13226]|uniref:Ankyrin repeat domain-containing protein n=1 Tax=Ignatzschineria larvae DSM 13226 TaxID=1111732 RepID=A0ABZ3BWI2_9GAMM|nr:ankyrin repeat domain-containing protein [Ignatzschineria larvae]